jgi:hypothetical protein
MSSSADDIAFGPAAAECARRFRRLDVVPALLVDGHEARVAHRGPGGAEQVAFAAAARSAETVSRVAWIIWQATVRFQIRS